MSEVRVLRLRSGEDLITQIKSNGGDTVVLKDPQVMIMRDAGQGKLSFAFIPFFPFLAKGGELSLKADFICINEEPNAELLSNYNQNFGSGLVIAPAGSVPPSDGKGGILGARIV